MRKTQTQVESVQIDLGYIKRLLANANLLGWVRKFSADNLNTETKSIEDLGIKTTENSLMLMDSANIKALVTEATYEGKVHSSYSLEQIAELIKVVGSKGGQLLITENPQTPLIVRLDSDLVVVAPTIDYEKQVEKKADDDSDDEESEETNDEDIDESEAEENDE